MAAPADRPGTTSILALGAAIALGAGLLAVQSVAAAVVLKAMPNPVTVAAGASQGTTIISFDTGSSHLAQVTQDPGGLLFVNNAAGPGSKSATVYCDKTNAFTLKDATTGATLASITVEVKGCPSSGGPSIPITRSSPPCIATDICAQSLDPCVFAHTCGPAAPATLSLSPSRLVTSSSVRFWHEGPDCQDRIVARWESQDYSFQSTTAVKVGYANLWDEGTGPLYCARSADAVYRGGVGFDVAQVSQFIQAHGLKSAAVSYSYPGPESQAPSCVGQIQVSGDDWDSWTQVPELLPGGTLIAARPQQDVDFFHVDVTSFLALGAGLGGINPHLHFVFIGKNENYDHDSFSCVVQLSFLSLDLIGDR